MGNKLDLVLNTPASESDSTPTLASPKKSPDSDDEEEEEEEDDGATATPLPADEAEEGGAKKDNASKRAVSTEEGEAYAKECGLLFFETSAKTGEGVVEVFTEIGKSSLPLLLPFLLTFSFLLSLSSRKIELDPNRPSPKQPRRSPLNYY